MKYEWFDNGHLIANVVTTTNRLDVGTHEITLFVGDGIDTSTATQVVRVLTASEVAEVIIAQVERSELKETIVQPLFGSLRAAAASLEKGHLIAGVNQIAVFEKKVSDFIAPFDPSLAESLVVVTHRLLDVFASP